MRIEKTIREFIGNREFSRVAPDETVIDAVEIMKRDDSDFVLVCKDDKLVGIFTERDFLMRIAAPQKDPAETPVGEVMTAEPQTLTPEDCVTYAINRMAVGGFRNVPIVDTEGKAIACLTVHDVTAHLEEVFDEVDNDDYHESSSEWTDIGGG